MYNDQPYEHNLPDWLNILEEHFKERKKAFLVFDLDHILRHVSEFASELLEISSSQIGVLSRADLFPRLGKNKADLVGSGKMMGNIQDITYTRPSGKPVGLRLSYDTKQGINGYVIWVEPHEREMTGTYHKVSSLKIYSQLKYIFDSVELGFMILDKNGVVSDINDHIKHVFRLPGEWVGRNLFTFPPLHQNRLSDFIQKFITGHSKNNSKVFKIKYSSTAQPVNIILSGTQLYDLSGDVSGALFICKLEN